MAELTGEPCKEYGDMTDEEYVAIKEGWGEAILYMPSVMASLVGDIRRERAATAAKSEQRAVGTIN